MACAIGWVMKSVGPRILFTSQTTIYISTVAAATSAVTTAVSPTPVRKEAATRKEMKVASTADTTANSVPVRPFVGAARACMMASASCSRILITSDIELAGQIAPTQVLSKFSTEAVPRAASAAAHIWPFSSMLDGVGLLIVVPLLVVLLSVMPVLVNVLLDVSLVDDVLVDVLVEVLVEVLLDVLVEMVVVRLVRLLTEAVVEMLVVADMILLIVLVVVVVVAVLAGVVVVVEVGELLSTQ
jgi:hypothetical protein